MPCYQCRAEFSFFKKELACKGCGFSFCSTCLSHEAKISESKKHPEKVCVQCYRRLTGTQKPKKDVDPDDYLPENFKKRLAELDKRKNRPTPYKRGPKPTSTDPSKSIEARLAALQHDRLKNVASVEEIEDRLHRLKRQEKVTDEPAEGAASNFPSATGKPPSDEESVRRLLEQKWAESRLDAGAKPSDDVPADVLLGRHKGDEDDPDALMSRAAVEAREDADREQKGKEKDASIAARLRKLQGVDGAAELGASAAIDAEDLTEEEQVARLVKQLEEEARIESSLGGSMPTSSKRPDDEVDQDEKELPWCCICNADAQLRCRGCDNDLYCTSCYRQGHRGEDPHEHPTVPF